MDRHGPIALLAALLITFGTAARGDCPPATSGAGPADAALGAEARCLDAELAGVAASFVSLGRAAAEREEFDTAFTL